MMEFEWLTETRNYNGEDFERMKSNIFEDDPFGDFEKGMFIKIQERTFNMYPIIDYALIIVDNKPVGMLGYYSVDNNNYWLGWFGILKEFRNLGYGEQALRKFEKFIMDKGAKTIRLYTGLEVNKSAVKLYKKLNYIQEPNI